MCGEYEVYYGGQQVGTAWIQKNGLYYRVEASCQLQVREMVRLKAFCGGNWTDFGLMIPDDDRFVLRKDIPQKHLSGEKLQFCIYKKTDQAVKFDRTVPFSYLHLLGCAKLTGQACCKFITLSEIDS